MQKYLKAIVVREEHSGKKVFHKYRTVNGTEPGQLRFQRAMHNLNAEKGRLIHINYYDKNTDGFLKQWRCNIP